jgi:hypothetical protein
MIGASFVDGTSTVLRGAGREFTTGSLATGALSEATCGAVFVPEQAISISVVIIKKYFSVQFMFFSGQWGSGDLCACFSDSLKGLWRLHIKKVRPFSDACHVVFFYRKLANWCRKNSDVSGKMRHFFARTK